MQQALPFSNETSDSEILATCRNFKQSMRLSLHRSGKSAKVIALELSERGFRMDEPTLSAALADNPAQKKNFPAEAIDDFIELTTDIPRRYLALKGGFTLIRLKSQVELENEKLRTALLEKDRELETVARFFSKAGISSVRA